MTYAQAHQESCGRAFALEVLSCTSAKLVVCIAGGRLQLVSMPGYGTDAFLNLKRLEGDWQEQQAEATAPLLTEAGSSLGVTT